MGTELISSRGSDTGRGMSSDYIFKNLQAVLHDKKGWEFFVTRFDPKKENTTVIYTSLGEDLLREIRNKFKIDLLGLTSPTKYSPVHQEVLKKKRTVIFVKQAKKMMAIALEAPALQPLRERKKEWFRFISQNLPDFKPTVIGAPITVNHQIYGILRVTGKLERQDMVLVQHHADLVGYALEKLALETKTGKEKSEEFPDILSLSSSPAETPGPGQEEILSMDDLSRMLKIGKKTIYDLVHKGVIPARKIGREWRFMKSLILDWITKTTPRS